MVLLGLLGLYWAYSPHQNRRPILFVAHSLGGLVCEDVSDKCPRRSCNNIEAIAEINDAL